MQHTDKDWTAQPALPLFANLECFDRRVATLSQRRINPFQDHVVNLQPLLEGDPS